MTNETSAAVLDAYLESKKLPVPHAVLIDGPWGSGKTFFLENIYEPDRQNKARADRFYKPPFLIVSLFGATSAADVEKRIFDTAHPHQAALGRLIGWALKTVGEYFKVKDAAGVATDRVAASAIKRLGDHVFVFDDLERVEKNALGEVMGVINTFVTTYGRRVILVADETKLRELHEHVIWKEQNEKIVGRRVKIEPDIESVVRVSISGIPDQPVKDRLQDVQKEILELVKRSGVENLRHLSWAIDNAIRFARCLLADSEIPVDHVNRVVFVIIVTTLWYRANKLDRDALAKLKDLRVIQLANSLKGGSKDDNLDAATASALHFSRTFADLKVESPPLHYQFIADIEDRGILKDAEVLAWIKTQFGFGAGHAEPSWRQVWHSFERPMAATEAAIDNLASELADRVYTKREEILHSLGQALKLLEAGDTRLTGGADVVTFFKSYIDGLADGEKLVGEYFSQRTFEYGGSSGLGYSSKESPEFQEVAEHLRRRLAELRDKEQGQRAQVVICEAEAGAPSALYRLLDDNDDISRKPALSGIGVERMATLLCRDIPYLNVGAGVLAMRYQRARCGDDLSAEIPWAREVYQAALTKIEEWSEPHRTMSKQTLQSAFKHYEANYDPKNLISTTAPEVTS